MSLYKELVENISFAIKTSLNEMAKKIDHRTVDRKLWLSVASVCSRNKETECEFIKPMKKLTKQDLLDRYVIGLIILKKPCPKSIRDIEKLKSFKLLGQRAIELGATIDEIKDLYNVNSGNGSAKPAAPVKPATHVRPSTSKPVVSRQPVKPVVSAAPVKKPRAPRSPINKKYITRFDNISASIKPQMYSDIDTSSYVSEYDKVYKACKSDLEKYIKSYIRKSGQNMDQFVSLLREDIINVNKLTGESKTPLCDISVNIGSTKRGWDYYNRYLHIQINADSYKMFIHFSKASFNSNSEWDEKFEYKDLLKQDLNKCAYWVDKPNIMDSILRSVYMCIVKPYVLWKRDGQRTANAGNSQATLKKYGMLTTPSDYYTWMRTYIYKILDNNEKIRHRYVDEGRYGANGIVDEIYKYKSNYYAEIVTWSGSTDGSANVPLSDILRDRRGYSYRYVDNDRMKYVRDTDDAIFRSSIDDIDEFCKSTFNAVKADIEKGIII